MGTKISGLTLLPTPTGNEAVPVQSGGSNYRVTLTSIAALVTKQSLGLENVSNTSDADKPVSTAQAQALQGKANTQHGHAVTDVTGLSDTLTSLSQSLQGKAGIQHTHSTDQVTGLNDTLNAIGQQLGQKASVNHTHTISQIQGLNDAFTGVNQSMAAMQLQINQKASVGHTHTASDITNFSAAVEAVVNDLGVSGDVVVGALEW